MTESVEAGNEALIHILSKYESNSNAESAGMCAEIAIDRKEPTLSREMIMLAQEEKPDFLKEELNSNLKLTHIKMGEGHRLYGVVNKFRPWIPYKLRPLVFCTLHDTIHQGGDQSVQTISNFYFWPSLVEDVKRWSKCCPKCQKCKVTRHNKQKLQNYPGDVLRFQVLHMDLMGPLPESDDYRYVLTIRDRGTGFVICTPIKTKTSHSVITGFRSAYIATFGLPTTIVTDNGMEFKSALFVEFCRHLDIKHKRVTAYHPQANGFVERVHRTIKVALRALEDRSEWPYHLPFVQLFLNNQVSKPNCFSPYQLAFGQTGNLPGAFVDAANRGDRHPMFTAVNEALVFTLSMSRHRRLARALPTTGKRIERELFNVRRVLVRVDGPRSSLEPRYRGPFVVVERHEKYFSIYGDDGMKNISIDRIKAYHELSEPDCSDDDEEEESSTSDVTTSSDESSTDDVTSDDE